MPKPIFPANATALPESSNEFRTQVLQDVASILEEQIEECHDQGHDCKECTSCEHQSCGLAGYLRLKTGFEKAAARLHQEQLDWIKNPLSKGGKIPQNWADFDRSDAKFGRA
jgi:hypothetical protein